MLIIFGTFGEKKEAKEDVEKIALEVENVKKQLEGKEIKKIIADKKKQTVRIIPPFLTAKTRYISSAVINTQTIIFTIVAPTETPVPLVPSPDKVKPWFR